MDPVPSDKAANIDIPVWPKYKELIKKHEGPQVCMQRSKEPLLSCYFHHKFLKESSWVVWKGQVQPIKGYEIDQVDMNWLSIDQNSPILDSRLSPGVSHFTDLTSVMSSF